MKQNTFSKWTKIYAEFYYLKVDERKSGAERYFTLKGKYEKAVEVGRMNDARTEADKVFDI